MHRKLEAWELVVLNKVGHVETCENETAVLVKHTTTVEELRHRLFTVTNQTGYIALVNEMGKEFKRPSIKNRKVS